MNTQKEILTFNDATEFLQVKESKLRSMIFRKEIPFYKIGALIRFDKKDLIDYLEKSKVMPFNEGR